MFPYSFIFPIFCIHLSLVFFFNHTFFPSGIFFSAASYRPPAFAVQGYSCWRRVGSRSLWSLMGYCPSYQHTSMAQTSWWLVMHCPIFARSCSLGQFGLYIWGHMPLFIKNFLFHCLFQVCVGSVLPNRKWASFKAAYSPTFFNIKIDLILSET